MPLTITTPPTTISTTTTPPSLSSLCRYLFTLPDAFRRRTSTLSRCQPAPNPVPSWPIRIFSISSPTSSSYKTSDRKLIAALLIRMSKSNTIQQSITSLQKHYYKTCWHKKVFLNITPSKWLKPLSNYVVNTDFEKEFRAFSFVKFILAVVLINTEWLLRRAALYAVDNNVNVCRCSCTRYIACVRGDLIRDAFKCYKSSVRYWKLGKNYCN